ncbi:MAG: enoyl-CoA hydratase family protein [Myxococcales bacterium]|nr:enoyl-CoA hydratase family protein [Myxococcota bacterium]MDW8283781.1 enoyl-CoA hydratase family protein [Myxococcales bacterium]
MIAPRSFRYQVSDGIATITLDRPQTLNSLTFEVYRELTDTMRALNGQEEVRAVVLTGEGRAFCSGGNVHEIIGELVRMPAPDLLAFTRLTGELVVAIRSLSRPVVAALHGIAAGAGAVIALACDLRVAAESASLAFLFVRVGLAGADMGAAWLLPRVVGLGRASELLLLGDAVGARDALAMGLVNRVVPDGLALGEAQAMARRLADGPGFALAMTKKMLDQEASMALHQAIEAEAQAQQICMQTQDFREAYEAFVARRPPRFIGR